MSPADLQHPVVLIIAGNDPSGGAGISADIQTVSALGAHPAPTLTALTVQDTRNAYEVDPVAAELIVAQARAVFADMSVAAVKIGLLATAAAAAAVAGLLREHPALPIVLDPVLVAAGGAKLAEDALIDVLLEELLPLTTVLTPNAHEVRRLAPAAQDTAARAAALLGRGAGHVLVKGGDEPTDDIRNVLFGPPGRIADYRWSRLPHSYHGSGCTLASAIAARLAWGDPVEQAVAEAQRYTMASLEQAFRPGSGQHVPGRWPAAGR